MGISAKQVMDLRETTGLPLMECKQALVETNGNVEGAVVWLREHGKTVSRRNDKATNSGYIGVYTHLNNQICVMVELACETDFVAKNSDFQATAKEIAMHCASAQPKYITADAVPSDVVEQETKIVLAQNPNKPEHIIAKIAEGNMKKFHKTNVLMDQVYVRDNTLSVGDLVNNLRSKVRENIFIKSVVYLKVGVAPTVLTV